MEETELTELTKQCITSLYLCTENISKYLANEKDEEFEKLRKCVQQYCTLEAEQKVVVEAKERAKTETDTFNINTLDKRFQTHLSSIAKKGLRVDKHRYMLEFNKRYMKGLQAAMNAAVDDSDLAIDEAQTQEQYFDPITKRPIKDPVRNTLCKHIYERDSIMGLIQQKKQIRCPVVGCGIRNYISTSHLMSDDELKFRMNMGVHSTMIQERSVMDLDDTR